MKAYRPFVAPSPLAVAIAAVLYGGVTLMPVVVSAEDSAALEAIVVTARKRTESVQDISASIDVYSREALDNLAISKVEDFANRTPSISMISIGPGTQYLFIRGASDGSNPEVPSNSVSGYFLNDVSVSYFGGIPDLHSLDMERIEVLNGPQGTLWGSGSMSGAVRQIPSRPDPSAFSGGLSIDGSGFAGGNSVNHTEEGYLNIPLGNGSTAIRVAGFHQKQGGFIDNLPRTRNWVNGTVSTNAEWAGDDYNTQTFKGGRIALLHNINEDWRFSISADYQQQVHNGAWDHDPERYGDLNVARFGPEWGDNYNTIAQAKLEGDVGIGDLTYIAGFYKTRYNTITEYSEYVQYVDIGSTTPEYVQQFSCADYYFVDCNVPLEIAEYRSHTKRLTQELRLQSKGEGRTNWIVGGYYEKTDNDYSNFYRMPGIQHDGAPAQYLINNYGGEPFAEEWYSGASTTNERQTALFGEANYALTEQWRVTGGVRWFEAQTTSNGFGKYFYEPLVYIPSKGKWSKTTFRAGIEYKPRASQLYYFSFSQGFRPGVINTGLEDNPAVPRQSNSDTLNNFELGWKTEYDKGRYRWNGSFYVTDWKDFQTAVFDFAIAPTTFYANIGSARIIGMESSIEARPTQGLTLSLAASYNDSQIINNSFANPDFPVVARQRLPTVPYLKASAAIRYEWPVFAEYRAYAQYDHSHTGSMQSSLDSNARSLQPAYDIGSLRFGVDQADGRWSAEAYVSNVTNERAVVFINTYLYDSRITTNAPRSVGLRLKYRFGDTGN